MSTISSHSIEAQRVRDRVAATYWHVPGCLQPSTVRGKASNITNLDLTRLEQRTHHAVDFIHTDTLQADIVLAG